MREKIERDALGGSRLPRGGGVRLTEFESERSDGYVRRLDKEATSFFFTNFSEEALAGDLWKKFARFGRVGEVYIPQKLTKWGCRFGFVKYKEVKNVVELERSLGDVWMGTFKLRINLSRFAKGSSSNQSTQVGDRTSPGRNEVEVQPGISFRTALVNFTPEPIKQVADKGKAFEVSRQEVGDRGMVVEPERCFLQVLKKSFVGRLVNGGEIKTIQLNLCLEGFREVKVAALGGDKILIFSYSEIDIDQLICRTHWWKGVVENFVQWSPNSLPSRRDIWVNIYGVPLQCWGELLFKMVTENCGEYLFMDVETYNKSRLDVARVKLSCPLLGNIDRVVPVVVQGVSTVVRVVEERGCVFEDDRKLQEDQLQWSVAASSCKSLDQGPAMAMVEESVLGDSDSDGSVGDQVEAQTTKGTAEHFDRMKKVREDSFVSSDSRLAISSLRETEKVCEGDIEEDVSVHAEKVRGLTSLVDVVACEHLIGVVEGPTIGSKVVDVSLMDIVDTGVGPYQVGVTLLEEGDNNTNGLFVVDLNRPASGLHGIGPVCVRELEEVGIKEGRCDVSKKDQDGLKLGHSMSENFDIFLKGCVQNKKEKQISNSGSDKSKVSSHLDLEGGESNSFLLAKEVNLKNRKTPLRLQSLPTMGVPKCVRFMGAIQASSRRGNQRKATSLEEGVVWSAGKLTRGSNQIEMTDDGDGGSEDAASSSKVVRPRQHQPNKHVVPQSRVFGLLRDESLDDVDSFVVSKKLPEAIAAEASKLMAIQKDLGLNIVSSVMENQSRLVEMEIRDQQKMFENEEAQRQQ
ncbi:RNA recognition motif [Trifolium medium]|uniref:RNA recognition motif n=1 Tax=Trifolium medium TaxID=97028 RepID=A0A392M051_9FABA|nr:RNA recognition motif [Trifolium medium]